MKLYFTLLILAFANGIVARHKDSCKQTSGSTNIKSFWGNSIKVDMPCKYNAVRQTCGDYFINITPGILILGAKLRLNTVWFSLEEKTGDKRKWEGRTTNKHAVKFINDKTSEFLTKKRGDEAVSITDLVDFSVERGQYTRTAVAKAKGGSFTFKFTPWDPNRKRYKKSKWSFECHQEFDIAPYPKQVCGGNKSHGFMFNDSVNDFGLTGEQMFLYNVFAETETEIAQVDDQCQRAEDIFQDKCPDNATRKDAIITCGQILTDTKRRKCVTKYSCSPMDVFVDCLDWVCGGYENNTLCESVAFSIDFCRNVTFPDGSLTEKVETANCFKDFIPIDDDDDD